VFKDRPLRSISKVKQSKKKAGRGYSKRQIKHALNPCARILQPTEKPTSAALLSYVRRTYSHFSKILAKLVGLRPTNISKFFHSVNDDLGMNTLGA